MSDLVEVSLFKILQTRTYTVIILKSDQQKFAIYMEPHVGQIAQDFFSNEQPARPQTFDFIDRLVLGLDLQVVKVQIYDLEEATYYAKILFKQPNESITNLVDIDARPSDALLMALRHRCPVFCSKKVLDETVEYIEAEDS